MSKMGGPKALQRPRPGYHFLISAKTPRSKANRTVHCDKEEEEGIKRGYRGAEEGEMWAQEGGDRKQKAELAVDT